MLRVNCRSRVQEQHQTSIGTTELDWFFGVQMNRPGSLSNLHRGNRRYALLQLEPDENEPASYMAELCRSIVVPSVRTPVFPPLDRHPHPTFPLGILYPPLSQCVS